MPAASTEVEELVDRFISDVKQPLVLFALEWCEFCWAVRKLFAGAAIPYRMVGLDSVEYQRDDRGGQVRSALKARSGSITIPQVFLGGEFIGGCSETFDAYRSGQLQQRLVALGVPFDSSAEFDPAQLLPGWVHKR
ncbi:MAG TPA: glutaredoxin domain-containing protein [Xanthomonadaceae bacterium]|nr:glutaredoxin domain-containing protein [Xanthomonadaceae bacterium]